MKKLFLIAFTALLSASCYSQKDTVHVHDTTTFFERTDTVAVQIMYAKKGYVRYASGFVIRNGMVQVSKEGMRYVRQPEIVATVDEKFRTIKNIIQIQPKK